MQFPASITADDIDRKALRALRERLMRLYRERLAALRAQLNPGHRVFIDALPLLLHSNHAALPGFIDFDMPCGIEHYTPERGEINAVRKIALSFTQERFVERRTQIQALYLSARMREDAVMTLTLSVFTAMGNHAALKAKLAGIVRYAAQQGLALTTTLIDPVEAHAGRGSHSTPCLARDEFYRSAILLAGRYPIWWLVPPQMEAQHDAYCARLKAQRFIGRDETLDLGPARRIPRSECLHAGITHLDAALAAPYAHLHVLMLLESYAADAAAPPLAHLYKSRVWDNAAGIDAVTLAHDSIATHLLLRQEPDRLQLARHCLLATAADGSTLAETATSWGWSEAQLRHARSNGERTITELQRENVRVNGELERAHRQLMQLASLETTVSPQQRAQLAKLGSQIAQLTAQPEGVIPRINPALLPQRIAGMIRLETYNRGWRLNDGVDNVFAAPRLVALLVWAHLHKVNIDNLRISDAILRQACARMLEFFAEHARVSASSDTSMLVINAEESPPPVLKAQGDAMVTDWDDSLDFSGFHTSLVASVDVVDVRSGVASCAFYSGDDGLIEVLLRLLTPPLGAVRLRCIGGDRRRAIEERIGALIDQLSTAFGHHPRVARFVFALAEGFVILERTNDKISSVRCPNEDQLFEKLALPATEAPGIRVDPRNPRLSALHLLCKLGSDERDALLVHEQRTTVSVLLLTHEGTIHRFEPPPRPAQEIAESLSTFFAQRHDAGNRTPDIRVAKGSSLCELTPPEGRLPTMVTLEQQRNGSIEARAGNQRWSTNVVDASVLDRLASAITDQHLKTARYPGYVASLQTTSKPARLAALLDEKFAIERQLARRLKLA